MSKLLTQEERDRFAAWLEVEAATAAGIAEQMRTAGNFASVFVEHEAAYAAAAALIARRLRQTESMSIG